MPIVCSITFLTKRLTTIRQLRAASQAYLAIRTQMDQAETKEKQKKRKSIMRKSFYLLLVKTPKVQGKVSLKTPKSSVLLLMNLSVIVEHFWSNQQANRILESDLKEE